MKKIYYNCVYRLFSRFSAYWNNGWINKYKIACGAALVLINNNCHMDPKKSDGNIPEFDYIMCYEPSVPIDYYTNEPEEDIPVIVEEMPQFPGGDSALNKYLQETPVYPFNAFLSEKEGRVICQFIIDEEGCIRNAEVIRGIVPELDEEALRVINNMPAWRPGFQNGKATKVQYVLPVSFHLPKKLSNNNPEEL